MMITKQCERCGTDYRVPQRREQTARFCSRKCKDIAGRVERRNIKCNGCGEIFNTPQDHGVWPRFCSRDCFLENCIRPEEKSCANCGSMFLADKTSTGHSEDGRRLFCSNACRYDGRRLGTEHTCVNCGQAFYQSPTVHNKCCSKKCSAEFYRADRSPGWKGGRYVADGTLMEHVERPGYAGKYAAVRRLVAAKAIGRHLFRWECVIYVHDRGDDSPDNLFICSSIGEMRHRYNGNLPWPTKSNLDTYADRETRKDMTL